MRALTTTYRAGSPTRRGTASYFDLKRSFADIPEARRPLRPVDLRFCSERVLAIPQKRAGMGIVPFLTKAEVDALLAEPDRSTRSGRRDHALLTLALQTGGATNYV